MKRGSRTRFAPILGVLTALLLLAAKPAKDPAHWQLVGPGGGGALFVPTISPLDPNRVLVACDMTGSYLSDDGGETWHTFNLRGRVHWFVFDPTNPDVIYAQSLGLWRSTDAGRTWNLILPNPTTIQSVAMSDDHAGESLITTADRGTTSSETVTALAVDPAESRTLYAVMRRKDSDQLLVSNDGARTWKTDGSLPERTARIYIDPNSPVHGRALLIAGKNTIWARESGNWHHGEAPAGVTAFTGVSIGFSNAGGPIVYATSSSGIFVSENGGTSWRQSELPGNGAEVRAIAASPRNPRVAYLSYSKLKQDKTYFGVARTTDLGHSWELVWKEADQPAANLRDAWITQFFGPQYGENPIDLAVAPSNPDIVYSTDYGRVLRTSDGGRNWTAAYSTRKGEGGFAGRGLENTTTYGVHFDPFDSRRMFITYTDIGLFRSEDGGQSWTEATDGVPHSWRNTTYWIVFDPEVRGRAWAVMSRTHDLPRAKMWQNREASSYDGGVMVSDDGGRTWRKSSEGIPPAAATHILLDPTSPVQARTLYVAAFGRGVYKSVNGGRTWALKNNGLAGADPLAWRLVRNSSGGLYVIISRRSIDGSFGNENDGAIYYSHDGAEHWTKLALPTGVNGPNGLAIDPHDSQRMYLAAWGRNTPPRAQSGGIYLSTDGGKTWRNVLARDRHVYDVTIDPRDPRILYAAGFESSAWRSTDRGLNWTRIPGFNFKWAHRVIPDPADAAKIYITTFGSGVWHGPATGDTGDKDEIATPTLAHGH